MKFMRSKPRRTTGEFVARALWSEWSEYDGRLFLGEVHALAKRQDLGPPPLEEVAAFRDRPWKKIPAPWRYLMRVWLTGWEGP